LEAGIGPEALTVMASVEAGFAAIDGNLARAQAGAERLTEKRVHDQAGRGRAAIDEPVIYASAQAKLEAAATAEKAETGPDAGLEI